MKKHPESEHPESEQPESEQCRIDLIDNQTAYRGFVDIHRLLLRQTCFQGGWSPPFERELCVRKDAVGILLYDPDSQQVGLVEQLRVGAMNRDISPWLLEIVAGWIDKSDETPAMVAMREAQEEAGLVVDRLEPIAEYFASPGVSTDFLSLFVGKVDLQGNTGGIYGLANEHEDIRFHVIEVARVLDDVTKGRINNAMTLIALQWLALNKSHLDEKWSGVDAKVSR